MEQQKNSQLAKARAHIEQIKRNDKNRPKFPITQGDKEKKNSSKFNFICCEKSKGKWIRWNKRNG